MLKFILRSYLIFVMFSFPLTAVGIEWSQLNAISKTQDGFEVTGFDPWLLSETFSKTAPKEESYFLMDIKVSRPMSFQIYWWKKGQGGHFSRMHNVNISQPGTYVKKVIDLDRYGRFEGADLVRIGPVTADNFSFDIKTAEFISKDKVPHEHFRHLVEMKCFTSKLHYLPCENIEYKTVLLSKNYPETRSSKILKTKITDLNGKIIHQKLRHYGIADLEKRKELFCCFSPDKLKPGAYTLHAESKDQMTGLTLTDTHNFMVIDENFPYVYETPFRYVKDFSIIRDSKGLWHIFSITGEFIEGHDWIVNGNERTFSHGTSTDLRSWTYHEPVLSISEKKYSDGDGYYEDKGVWAPNVISHNGKYYMFYTSTNSYVSQSISLAVSEDLYEWQKHKHNPVFNLEGLDWANWERGRWADCRDPEIFKDGDIFYMYLTAHAANGDPRGIVAVAESKDLIQWKNPKIAVRHRHAMESPQVWKKGDKYFMTTSAHGGGVWVSDKPDSGWKPAAFARPNIQAYEKHVKTSGSYAEEVFTYGDKDIIAGLTWRHYGNTIYIFQIDYNKEGFAESYLSPFEP